MERETEGGGIKNNTSPLDSVTYTLIHVIIKHIGTGIDT